MGGQQQVCLQCESEEGSAIDKCGLLGNGDGTCLHQTAAQGHLKKDVWTQHIILLLHRETGMNTHSHLIDPPKLIR